MSCAVLLFVRPWPKTDNSNRTVLCISCFVSFGWRQSKRVISGSNILGPRNQIARESTMSANTLCKGFSTSLVLPNVKPWGVSAPEKERQKSRWQGPGKCSLYIMQCSSVPVWSSWRSSFRQNDHIVFIVSRIISCLGFRAGKMACLPDCRFLSIEYNPTLLWLMLLTRRFYPGDGELNIEICWNNCNFLSNIPFIIAL